MIDFAELLERAMRDGHARSSSVVVAVRSSTGFRMRDGRELPRGLVDQTREVLNANSAPHGEGRSPTSELPAGSDHDARSAAGEVEEVG